MKQAFHFKGGNYTISAISINTTDIKQIKSLLNSKVSQSDYFFKNTAFAIDIREIDDDVNTNINFLDSMFAAFKEKEMIPIGFVTNNASLKSSLAKSGHNLLKNTRLKNEKFESDIKRTSKIITSPVRTGQTIEAPDSDLIITANVNNGAELVADGSIIVFGSIGGRVLAGSSGDKTAKIICKQLKADLVSMQANM
jgi:septum site-determining protein MinC